MNIETASIIGVFLIFTVIFMFTFVFPIKKKNVYIKKFNHGPHRRVIVYEHRNGETYWGSVNEHDVGTPKQHWFALVFLPKDSVSCKALTLWGLKREFKKAVDDYLDFCEFCNDTPEKPLSTATLIKQ